MAHSNYILAHWLFRINRRGLLLLGCQTLVCATLFAQSDTTKKLREVEIRSAVNKPLPGITPSQQITAKDFARYSAFTVADAVRNFAGVNLKDYGGIGGLKTVSVRSLGASHTAVLFDGVQISDAQNGQIDLSKFNLNNLQQITLYNGQPTNLLQPARSFAAASVLSIKAIKPQLSPQKPYQALFGLNGGSFGLISPYLQWQQRINHSWALIVNANYISANGHYQYKVDGDGSDTLAIRRNGDIKSLQSDVALYWQGADSSRFNIRINYYNSKRGLPGAVIYYNPNTNERLDNYDAFIQAGYEHKFANGLRLLANTKLSQLKTRYLDPDFLNAQGFLDQHYTQQEAYQSVSLAYRILPNWEVSYSLDAASVKLNADLFNYAYPKRFTLLNVLATNFAVGKWQLQGNLLRSNISDRVQTGMASKSRSVLSPTIMATLKPLNNDDLQLRAFYKNIFRAPTLDELYFYAITPRNIKPEFVKQFNVGINYSKNLYNLLEYISLSSDIYYNTVKDKILAVPNKNPAIFSFSNIGKVEIRGIDVGFKTQTRRQNDWVGLLTANYTYQRAQDVTNASSPIYLQQIPYTPKHTIALNAGVTYQQAGIYFNHILSSHRYYTINNLPEYLVPGYAVSDASAVYRFITNKLPATVSIAVDNLFNTNYAIIRSYPTPGRSYRLSFQITI